MKTFLEFHEDGQDYNIPKNLEAIGYVKIPEKFSEEFNKETEIDEKLKTLKMKAKGLKGKYKVHICNHIEAGEKQNRPCKLIQLQTSDTAAIIKDKLTKEGMK